MVWSNTIVQWSLEHVEWMMVVSDWELLIKDCRELGKVPSENIWKIELDVEWVIAIVS
jgi:hypothetical protein